MGLLSEEELELMFASRQRRIGAAGPDNAARNREKARHKKLCIDFMALSTYINEFPECRELENALDTLELASLWAHKAAERYDPTRKVVEFPEDNSDHVFEDDGMPEQHCAICGDPKELHMPGVE